MMAPAKSSLIWLALLLQSDVINMVVKLCSKIQELMSFSFDAAVLVTMSKGGNIESELESEQLRPLVSTY